jgi:hypothetical protein
MIDESKLEKLRLTYKQIQLINYSVPGGEENHFVIRKPNFEEYLIFNKYAEIVGEVNGNPQYELNPDVADSFLKSVIVYPDEIDIGNIPAGVIMSACSMSINMSVFEDQGEIRDSYIKSIKAVNTSAGAMRLKLISAFGIDGFIKCKNMDEHEIIELLTYVETITDSMGDLAKISGLEKTLPFARNGKLDVGTVIGVKSDDVGPKGTNVMSPEKKKKLTEYYRSLRYDDEWIEKTISSLENSGRQYDDVSSTTSDGKIDMGAMSDAEIKALSANEYNALKKEGKILSGEESKERALSNAKDILSKTIEEDRRQFGDREKPKTISAQHFTGDLNNLLADVKNTIKKLDNE